MLVSALLLIASCGGGGSSPRPAATWWPQPLHYRVDVSYADGRLDGTERLELRNTGPGRLSSVWLRLWGNAAGCGAVRVTVTAGGRTGRRTERCTAQEVVLDHPLAQGGRTALDLRLAIVTPDEPGRFGRGDGVASFGNALPTLAVADRRNGWRLPPYTERGESFFSLSAPWDASIGLRPGEDAAVTGSSRREGDTLRSHADHARDLTIVAGAMGETRLRARGVTLRRWSIGEDAADAARGLAAAARSLRAYERWFGPYGRDELDLVEPLRGSRFQAMEYPELVIAQARAGALDHEIAHQWFFGIVGNDEYREPWLDEAFATYAAHRRSGRRPDCQNLPPTPPVTAGMDVFGSDSAPYGPVVYEGGACALRAIERGLGRRRFDAMLRGVVRDHRDGVLTTAAFRQAVTEAAPSGAAKIRRALP